MRDYQWLVRNYATLVREHPKKWVAVHKGEVVAVGDDSGGVERMAQQRTGVSDVPVDFLNDGTVIY
jgi:hypothetical protein